MTITKKGDISIKKLIAFISALISLVSLAGVASADEAGINTNYAKVVSAMSEKGIISGFPDGSFQPDGTLTRAQAAKIICVMLEGPDKAESLTAEKSSFTMDHDAPDRVPHRLQDLRRYTCGRLCRRQGRLYLRYPEAHLRPLGEGS